MREYARNWYKNLPEDKKNIKRDDGKNRYHNMSDEAKQKRKKYQKNYLKMNPAKKKKDKSYKMLKRNNFKLTKMQS